MYVSVRNSGGRELRIKGTQISLSRDGIPLGALPAQNYFETPSSQSSVLFVPFTLKPEETWAHGTNFLQLFDRATEKLYRESESALSSDIRRKIAERAEEDKQAVRADPNLIQPFDAIFDRLFCWLPGEYVLELTVHTLPGSASFSRTYRFTLYESDAQELRSHKDDYPFGAGLSYNVDRHVGLSVPLLQHGS